MSEITEGSYATFQCPSVCGGAELALSPELKDVSLDGPPDTLLEARGTTREAAGEALVGRHALGPHGRRGARGRGRWEVMAMVTDFADCIGEALGPGVPAWLRAARIAALLLLASALVAVPAHAGIIEDAVKDGTQGMIDGIVRRVNYMAQVTIPTSFDSLLAGQGSAHVYAKAAQMYGSGVARSAASTLLGLVMLVQLAKINQRTEAHATFPAVREVAALLVACAIYTYLVGHAWDLMSALFRDLSGIWSSWGSEPATRVSSMNITDSNGLAVLLPMFLSCVICSVLVDVAAVISMIVVWGRGVQLYFMATMSPIPLALLGIDETRQMGLGFLRNYAGLVLGYAALSFVVKLFPTLLQMSIATSFVMGGDGEMILSITAACILEIILTVKCGSWARDVLGG